MDRRTKKYKELVKKQQEIEELDKLEKENEQLEETLDGIEIEVKPPLPTKRELVWLEKVEKQRMGMGPYPSPYEEKERKKLLQRIEFYKG